VADRQPGQPTTERQPARSPDGQDDVLTDPSDIDTEDAQVWTGRFGTDERREISTSKHFDHRPDRGRG
jgi:hypothetical protein